MNFEKAHAELLLGNKIRRKAWEPYMHLRLIDGVVKTYKGENITFYGNANFILDNDWRIVDGLGEKLTFIEALQALKQKQAIFREGRPDSSIFVDNGKLVLCIFVDNGKHIICKQVEFDFTPTFKCLCSNDWEAIK